ncbi:MAG: hypothetical protein ACRC7O_03245, partial [Fimbriiglobus sp.]
MATAPPRPARPAPRNYWQLPTFAVGLAAAVAAVAAFPPPPADPAQRSRDDLAVIRQLIDRKPPDPGTLEPIARRVAAEADADPQTANAANFLTGVAFVTLAETAPVADAAEHWAAAARAFAKVDPTKL